MNDLLKIDWEFLNHEFKSEIIKDLRTQKFLLSLMRQNIKVQLLYKSSRDGIDYKKFHQFCDNKGPTLSIIKSKDGDIFGGYTNIPWTSSDSYKKDKGQSFVFSAR